MIKKANWIALMACTMCLSQVALSNTLRDPTRPYFYRGVAVTSSQGRSALTSILISPSRRVAVIDGKSVAEGDKVGNVTVKHIDKNKVILQGEKGERTLSLISNVIKRKSTAR